MKLVQNALEALSGVQDGAVLAVGGFGLCGIPENGIAALVKMGVRNLVCVSNNAGVDDFGLGLLLQNRQIAKMVSSYVGENALFEKQFLQKELEVEFCPQGTLAERMRAGGAGIRAFFTPTGAGTKVAEAKETRVFTRDGKDYECVLEQAITADYALVKAQKGDALGNLVYAKTARNFNPLAAMCARVTVAEVEEVVPVGSLDPECVHTPGVYVQKIFQGQNYEKRIEQKTLSG